MNNKWAVIFDLDGTLLDTYDDLANAINHMLKKYGYPERSRVEIRRFLGNGARDLVTRSLPSGIDNETLEKFYEEYKIYYNENSQIFTKPYDGVIDVLRELRENGIQTAVVSNKPDMTVRKLCKQYFEGLVDLSVGDRPDIERKPSADSINFAIKELGCAKAIYVGDSEVDVLASKNAKLPCVSVTWGFRDLDVLEECGANIFANTSGELKQRIYELIKLYDN
jgi:phosphoglycolate phosphatase